MRNKIVSYAEIKSLVEVTIEEFGISTKTITEQANFFDDLGFDSIDFTELIMTLERSFDISIPFKLIEQSGETVGGLILIVQAQLR